MSITKSNLKKSIDQFARKVLREAHDGRLDYKISQHERYTGEWGNYSKSEFELRFTKRRNSILLCDMLKKSEVVFSASFFYNKKDMGDLSAQIVETTIKPAHKKYENIQKKFFDLSPKQVYAPHLVLK